MATTFQAVADVAISQLGVQEDASGATVYGQWYGMPNEAWCAMFLSWCGDQAAQKTPGASNPYADASNPKGFSFTETWRSSFIGKGAWNTTRDGMRPGDVVFWNHTAGRNVSHVGLCLEVGAGYYLTIEGNTYDRTTPTQNSRYVVRKHRENTTDGSFAGYGRVQYDGDPTNVEGSAGAETPVNNAIPSYTSPSNKPLIPRRTTPALTSTGALSAVRISGSHMPTDITERVTKMSLTLSSTERCSLQMAIQDAPDARITRSGIFDLTQEHRDYGTAVALDFADQAMQVTTVNRSPGAGGPLITVTAISAAIRDLTSWEHTGAVSFGVVQPDQWIKQMAASVGARYVVQHIGGPTEQVVWIRNPGQTTWEAMQLLAKAQGAVLFEHENTIYYGQPTWLAAQSEMQWDLSWLSWSDYSPGLAGMPTYEVSLDDTNADQLSFALNSADRGLIRPGHIVVFTTILPGAAGIWAVDTVEVEMLSSESVQVTCGRIVDPAPELPTGEVQGYLSNGTVTAGPEDQGSG